MKGMMTQMKDVAENQPYQLLPKGDYFFEISEITDSFTKNGDPMISLVLVVCSGEKKGAKVWDNITISANPQSPAWNIRWRAKMFLKAIGEAHHGDEFAWDSDRWLFKRCIGTVDHKKQDTGKYAGQDKAIIKKYSPIEGDGGFSKPVETKETNEVFDEAEISF